MGSRTGIQWTEKTWNPMVGCTHVSAGCDHCYAAQQASTRLAHTRQYQGLAVNGVFTGQVRLLPERLDQPLRWQKPSRIFVNSMSDLWHPAVPGQYQAEVWATMALTPRHQYQVLTKRPQRAARMLSDAAWRGMFHRAVKAMAAERGLQPSYLWPLPNVWLGASVEDIHNVRRIAALDAAPARIRFLSLEPLIGPLTHLRGVLHPGRIHWVIVGGESGPGARPMNLGWAYDIVHECQQVGIPVFVKQLGAVAAREWGMSDAKGGNLDEFPALLRVREYPPTPEAPTP